MYPLNPGQLIKCLRQDISVGSQGHRRRIASLEPLRSHRNGTTAFRLFRQKDVPPLRSARVLYQGLESRQAQWNPFLANSLMPSLLRHPPL